jgi:hypothetical protein
LCDRQFAAAEAPPVEIGIANVDVTPPVGYRMSGYFYERFSTGTHNPLIARAIVLRQGDQQFAWVFCDLIGVPLSVSSSARDAAVAKTGIPAITSLSLELTPTLAPSISVRCGIFSTRKQSSATEPTNTRGSITPLS